MQNLFLDTNVVIDFLGNRIPFSNSAAKLFNFSLANKARLYIAAVSFNNIYYILRQSKTERDTMTLLSKIATMATIGNVTDRVIKDSLISGFRDFEDAIQYNTALYINNIDAIVTRNKKDFKKSNLPILAPDEAVALLEAT